MGDRPSPPIDPPINPQTSSQVVPPSAPADSTGAPPPPALPPTAERLDDLFAELENASGRIHPPDRLVTLGQQDDDLFANLAPSDAATEDVADRTVNDAPASPLQQPDAVASGSDTAQSFPVEEDGWATPASPAPLESAAAASPNLDLPPESEPESALEPNVTLERSPTPEPSSLRLEDLTLDLEQSLGSNELPLSVLDLTGDWGETDRADAPRLEDLALDFGAADDTQPNPAAPPAQPSPVPTEASQSTRPSEPSEPSKPSELPSTGQDANGLFSDIPAWSETAAAEEQDAVSLDPSPETEWTLDGEEDDLELMTDWEPALDDLQQAVDELAAFSGWDEPVESKPDIDAASVDAASTIEDGLFNGFGAYSTTLDLEGDRELAELSSLRRTDDELDLLLPDLDDPLADSLADLLTEESAPAPDEGAEQSPISPPGAATPPRDTQQWYLGIDLGTTGISAVLLHRPSRAVYPLYWLKLESAGAPSTAGETLEPLAEKTFRLPLAVSLPLAEVGEWSHHPQMLTLGNTAQPQGGATHLQLSGLKPYLKAGVPYYLPEMAHWEPVLQWTEQHAVPLSTLHEGVRLLLSSLTWTAPAVAPSRGLALTCGAVGLEDAALQQALRQLSAVVVSCPSNWPDTYTFNVREAVLASRLVGRSEQVYFVDEAIAALLSELGAGDGGAVHLPAGLTQKPDLFRSEWHGQTLVLTAGAAVTELALVHVPTDLSQLAYGNAVGRSLPYGGHALDQDILCQLIYPAWIRQANRLPEQAEAAEPSADTPWHPDPAVVAGDPWRALQWEQLTLPVVGDADNVNRLHLQRRLLSAAVGQGLLDAARHLKLALQQRDRVRLLIGEQQLTITRQDLGSRVLLPYIQRLNRELNALLTQSGTSVLEVNQVLCTGGTASLAAIARWLRQKLPNATIIQDTYAAPSAPTLIHVPTCSRIAYGLATVPLHPQVVDWSRHQYSDYFLLMELLRVFPDAPMTLGSLMQTLERRGIQTQRCQPHILALLQGHLPPGLVPIERDGHLLTTESQQNPDYRALLAAPLFIRVNEQTYRPNMQQWQIVRQYLDSVIATSHQTLAEPLPITLALDVTAEP